MCVCATYVFTFHVGSRFGSTVSVTPRVEWFSNGIELYATDDGFDDRLIIYTLMTTTTMSTESTTLLVQCQPEHICRCYVMYDNAPHGRPLIAGG